MTGTPRLQMHIIALLGCLTSLTAHKENTQACVLSSINVDKLGSLADPEWSPGCYSVSLRFGISHLISLNINFPMQALRIITLKHIKDLI